MPLENPERLDLTRFILVLSSLFFDAYGRDKYLGTPIHTAGVAMFMILILAESSAVWHWLGY